VRLGRSAAAVPRVLGRSRVRSRSPPFGVSEPFRHPGCIPSRQMKQIDPSRWLQRAVRDEATHEELREAAESCQACDLWKRGTRTVFGEGPVAPHGARMVLVGEQPGDREDRSGRPFVGPAGRLLDDALAAAGIDRSRVYLTNAVKHFKWRASGKRRLHEKPSPNEVRSCLPWLEAELVLLQPDIVVLLGATAAQALFGSSFRVTRERGKLLSLPVAPRVLATVHPSSLLRTPDPDRRQSELTRFIADLKAAARWIAA
jgi:uracil-DNA glycosylase